MTIKEFKENGLIRYVIRLNKEEKEGLKKGLDSNRLNVIITNTKGHLRQPSTALCFMEDDQ